MKLSLTRGGGVQDRLKVGWNPGGMLGSCGGPWCKNQLQTAHHAVDEQFRSVVHHFIGRNQQIRMLDRF